MHLCDHCLQQHPDYVADGGYKEGLCSLCYRLKAVRPVYARHPTNTRFNWSEFSKAFVFSLVVAAAAMIPAVVVGGAPYLVLAVFGYLLLGYGLGVAADRQEFLRLRMSGTIHLKGREAVVFGLLVALAGLAFVVWSYSPLLRVLYAALVIR